MAYYVLFLSLLLIIANAWHVLSEWITNKPNELFTGIAHYYADYFLYISQIAQGAHGQFLFSNHLYTDEPLAPTWIYWFYVLLGKLSFLTNPFILYNVSLVILSGIVLFLLWKIIDAIYPKKSMAALVAFLFVATSSNFPRVIDVFSIPTQLLSDFWFSPTKALNRLGGVPHQIFQTILLLIIILLFSQYIKTKKDNPQSTNYLSFVIYHLPFAILAFLSGSGSPMQMLLLTGSIVITTLYFRHKHALLVFSIAIPALIGALLTTREFALQPILVIAKAWEDAQQLSLTPWQFFVALGPIGVLIPLGIAPFIRSLTPLKRVILFYGSFSIVAFFSPIPTLLHTSPTRWISPTSFILLPLLAAEGFQYISTVLHKFRSKIMIIAIVPTMLLITYLILTIVSLRVQIQQRSEPLTSDIWLKFLNHIPMPYVEGLQVIQQNPVNGVVLTDPQTPLDVIVPIFTDKRSFTGQSIHTLYPETKNALRQKFFSGKMSDVEVRQFFSDHAITYIIASSQNTIVPHYKTLKKTFENSIITIYVAL